MDVGFAIIIVVLFLIGGAVLIFAGAVLWTVVPVLIAVPLGVWLWRSGHDNIGLIVILAGFVAQPFWWSLIDGTGGGGWNPMSGKSKIYDKSGKVVGYTDKE